LSGFCVEKLQTAWGKISTAEVLRLRARNPLLRDKSARRFAQDDDSVGELTELAESSPECRSLSCQN
jgi:hypothetical protein